MKNKFFVEFYELHNNHSNSIRKIPLEFQENYFSRKNETHINKFLLLGKKTLLKLYVICVHRVYNVVGISNLTFSIFFS